MNTGKVVLGTLAGLAIGAIAGILFAPEKGSTTRKQIMDKSEDLTSDMKSKIEEFIDSLLEKFESGKKGAEEMISNGKEKFDEAKNEIKGSVSEARKTANSTFNS